MLYYFISTVTFGFLGDLLYTYVAHVYSNQKSTEVVGRFLELFLRILAGMSIEEYSAGDSEEMFHRLLMLRMASTGITHSAYEDESSLVCSYGSDSDVISSRPGGSHAIRVTNSIPTTTQVYPNQSWAAIIDSISSSLEIHHPGPFILVLQLLSFWADRIPEKGVARLIKFCVIMSEKCVNLYEICIELFF
jgi:hypothetical protein